MPYDFANLAFVNQFITAVNDRTQRFNSGTITPAALKSVGDDVQAAAFWGGLQAAVEACVPSFLRNDFTEGTPITTTFVGSSEVLTNGPGLIGNWTLATWRAAAGINASGFRRMTSADATAYGTMQAGDVIGDWVFDELAAGLRLLDKTAWTSVGGGRRAGTATGQSPSAYSGGNSVDDNPGSYGQARTRRNAAYASANLSGLMNPSNGYAQTTTDNDNRQLFGFNPPRQYTADVGIAIPVCRATSLPTTVSKSVEFWVACMPFFTGSPPATAAQFDANGFNVIDGCWSILQTVNAGTSATAAMSDPGHFLPNEAADATLNTVGTDRWSSTRGFLLNTSSTSGGVIAIVKWTFTEPPVWTALA